MLVPILVSAVFGAVGAAIGYAVLAIAFRGRPPEQRPKWIAAACVALAVGLSFPVGRWIATPTVDSAMREAEEGQPILALLREHEPAAYDRIRNMVAGMIESGRRDPDLAAREGRRVFSSVLISRSRTASDARIAEEVAFVRDQMAALQPRPDVCAGVLTGQAGDIRSALPPGMYEREQRIYEALLREPRQTDAPVMSDADLAAENERMLPALLSDTGMDAASLNAALRGQGSASDICRANQAFYAAMARMPDDRRGAYYRRLMQESRLDA